MARRVTLGNGNILVALDARGQVRDFYFPKVGHQNHVSGASGSFVHRIGISVDGDFRWLDDPSWQIAVGSDPHSVIGTVHATNEALGISLSSRDAIHNEKNIFIRSFTIENLREVERTVKVFFSQQFRISESRRGDTAFFEPTTKTVIHYKGHTNFLINARIGDMPLEDFSIGLFDAEGKIGTYLDAEDGKLERNPIEHGSVDSVVGVTAMVPMQGSILVHYWITCGASMDEAFALNSHVIRETPDALIDSTDNFWKAWLLIDTTNTSLFSPELVALYKRSLTTMRVHADNGGGIIAASDTEMLHHGRDAYSYVWPRDGAYIAHALDRAGYHDVAKRFFTFICERIESGGYLMHKYRSDGCLGSSWHPWVQNGVPQLPIQEDETAIVILMLWEHYHMTHDIELIEALYNKFIEPAADFMCRHLESSLGLPASSYDLWEERYSISTYTASSVCAALHATAQCAILLGKTEHARTYESVAQQIRTNIHERLYSEELGMFVKSVHLDKKGDEVFDMTLDMSSFFGPFYFGIIAPDDPKMERAVETVRKHLSVLSENEGYIRYSGDTYYKRQNAESPNPWIICTLWVAQYYIAHAKKRTELHRALTLIEWVASQASESGVLAEQMHPVTGELLSTAPLVWSHAQFVITINDYAKRYEELAPKRKTKSA